MEGKNGENENEVPALVFICGSCGILFVQYYTIELIPQTSEHHISTSCVQVFGDNTMAICMAESPLI